jgi:hypothetical protein
MMRRSSIGAGRVKLFSTRKSCGLAAYHAILNKSSGDP